MYQQTCGRPYCDVSQLSVGDCHELSVFMCVSDKVFPIAMGFDNSENLDVDVEPTSLICFFGMICVFPLLCVPSLLNLSSFLGWIKQLVLTACMKLYNFKPVLCVLLTSIQHTHSCRLLHMCRCTWQMPFGECLQDSQGSAATDVDLFVLGAEPAHLCPDLGLGKCSVRDLEILAAICSARPVPFKSHVACRIPSRARVTTIFNCSGKGTIPIR